jgi:hypothetical protein
VVDLGDGVGALIVRTDDELLGTEIEISPARDDDERQHKQVLRRALGPEVATCLVFDGLAEGEYTLWLADGPLRGIEVSGGAVAELDLRAGASRRASGVSDTP